MEKNTPHIHQFTDTVVPATCKEVGYTLHKCNCGYEHKDNFRPVSTHSYDIIEHVQATCTTTGMQKLRCNACGVEKIEDIPPLQHNWDEWVIKEFPTCTTPGKNFHVCNNCGVIEEREIPLLGHKLKLKQKSSTTDGMNEYFCENCGETVLQPCAGKKIKGFFAKWKKAIIGGCAILIALILLVILSINVILPEYHYAAAMKDIESGKYYTAYKHLRYCEDFKECQDLLDDFELIYRDITYFDADGTYNFSMQYQYDDFGNEIERVYTYDDRESDTYKTEYVYDQNGNAIKKIEYDSDGDISRIYTYEYDLANNLTIYNQYNQYERLQGSTRHTYDEKGNKIQTVETDNEGTESRRIEFCYDESGRVIEELTTTVFGVDGRSYEYDDKGQLVHEYLSIDGRVFSYYEYQYDTEGNMLFTALYNADQTLRWKAEYQYTHDKLWFNKEVTYIHYDKNGNIDLNPSNRSNCKTIYSDPIVLYHGDK